MKILIKKAKIIDTSSKYNNKTYDVLINNNIIEKIGKSIRIDAETKVYKNKNENSCRHLHPSHLTPREFHDAVRGPPPPSL